MILVTVFYMLGIVADRFLCPCLAEICKKLRVTQDLAISFAFRPRVVILNFNYAISLS